MDFAAAHFTHTPRPQLRRQNTPEPTEAAATTACALTGGAGTSWHARLKDSVDGGYDVVGAEAQRAEQRARDASTPHQSSNLGAKRQRAW